MGISFEKNPDFYKSYFDFVNVFSLQINYVANIFIKQNYHFLHREKV